MGSWRAIRALAVAGVVVGMPGYALAQGRSGVGLVTTLVGEATVARATLAPPLALKTHDDIFLQDRISTKEGSLVHVLMGGKALLTVRELSVLTVTEEAGRATVDLQSGKIGLAVVRQRMKPGEVIEIRTPNAVAAVRGTVLVVEIIPDSAGGDHPHLGAGTTNVHLLHGKLDVSLRSDPAAIPVQLETLQTVTVSGNTLGTARPLSPEAAGAITADLKANSPSRRGVPEEFRAALGQRQRDLAIATAEALVGRGHGRVRGGVDGLLGATKNSRNSQGAGSNRDAVSSVSDTGVGAGLENGNTPALENDAGHGLTLGLDGRNAGGNGGGQGLGLALGVGNSLGGGNGAGLAGGVGSLGSVAGGAGSGLATKLPAGPLKKLK